jgi:uncharacterized protein (TIGR02265 family)
MSAADDDLDARLATATPRDTVRGVVFNALFAVLEQTAGRPAAVECDPAGRGLRNEYFSYSVAEYLRIAWAATDRLSARLGSRERVFWELGNSAARRWLAGPLGATFLAFAGRDPKRLLNNAASGYRLVVSYGTRTIEWIGDRHARLRFRHDFLVPPFHCGVLTGAIEAASNVAIRAEGREVAFLDSDYDVMW